MSHTDLDLEDGPDTDRDRAISTISSQLHHATTDDSDDEPNTAAALALPAERIAGALVSLHGRLTDLIQYRALNREAFRKGFKKLDKYAKMNSSLELMPRVESAHFASSMIADHLKSQTEALYTNVVWEGDS